MSEWMPIDKVHRNQSVILCSWWRHEHDSPYIYEGYLAWDGTSWRDQSGHPIRPDISTPTHFMDMPKPPVKE
jgi:hypothetical protein